MPHIRKLLLHGISVEGVAKLLEIDIQTVKKISQSPEKSIDFW
jgi:hypothetical protein